MFGRHEASATASNWSYMILRDPISRCSTAQPGRGPGAPKLGSEELKRPRAGVKLAYLRHHARFPDGPDATRDVRDTS